MAILSLPWYEYKPPTQYLSKATMPSNRPLNGINPPSSLFRKLILIGSDLMKKMDWLI